jgi:hypothetical protein
MRFHLWNRYVKILKALHSIDLTYIVITISNRFICKNYSDKLNTDQYKNTQFIFILLQYKNNEQKENTIILFPPRTMREVNYEFNILVKLILSLKPVSKNHFSFSLDLQNSVKIKHFYYVLFTAENIISIREGYLCT